MADQVIFKFKGRLEGAFLQYGVLGFKSIEISMKLADKMVCIPFCYDSLCETGFSSYAILKFKKWVNEEYWDEDKIDGGHTHAFEELCSAKFGAF